MLESYRKLNKGFIMTEFEKQCYGMSESEINLQYMNSLTARFSGLEMVVMGVLSDVQELIGFGGDQSLEQARKELNRAKYILGEIMEAKKQKETA